MSPITNGLRSHQWIENQNIDKNRTKKNPRVDPQIRDWPIVCL